MTALVRPVADWIASSASARRQAKLRFTHEVLLCGSVYVAYSVVRNEFGSAAVEPETAARNADWIIDVQRALGLYIEAQVQDAFIDWTVFVQFWNLFYGLFHFLVTFGVLIWLYFADPTRYRFWRRAGLWATASALVGFAVFPLMPPRLLGDCGPYGACRPGSPYVDTVREVGGIWSFESSGVDAISNQYAAMPSLHIGWALWCTLVLVPRVRPRWAKALAISYPWLTLFAIVVTANHYWIDGLGGVAVVGFGLAVSTVWDRWVVDRHAVFERPASTSGVGEFDTTVGPGDPP